MAENEALTFPPKAAVGQMATAGAETTIITEGSVSIEYECRSSDTRNKGTAATDGPVFYNKVQVFNRDLSIMMIALFAQWRHVERAEVKAKRACGANSTPEARVAAARAEKARLYDLSAAELDARLKAEAKTDGIVILDALAATGLRSIRYAKEIPGVKRVISNDLEASATAAAARNVAANGVSADLCIAQNMDACAAMMTGKQQHGGFDVVDLDPYGSAAPFIDAAVQCVNEGGLICVTCTDMAVLSGNYPETCFAKYGAMPTRAKSLHEFSLRIVLNTLETSAARYQRHVVPVLSVSVDFYIRLFVRVYRKPIEVKKSCTRRSYVLQSTGCPSFFLVPIGRLGRTGTYAPSVLHADNTKHSETNGRRRAARKAKAKEAAARDAAAAATTDAAPKEEEEKKEAPKESGAASEEDRSEDEDVLPEGVTASDFVPPEVCGETGRPFKVGGPIWSDPIHDRDWVTAALDRINSGVDTFVSTQERIHGVLTAISEELPDVPLYYTLPDVCSTLHCASPKMAQMKAALMHAGFRCSPTHREPDAIKTDAPPRVVWDILRAWCKLHPVSQKRLDDTNSAVARILALEPKLEANFATTAAMRAKPTKARRWAPNPEEYWGPKAASHGRKHNSNKRPRNE